jgi:hypothetical protein
MSIRTHGELSGLGQWWRRPGWGRVAQRARRAGPIVQREMSQRYCWVTGDSPVGRPIEIEISATEGGRKILTGVRFSGGDGKFDFTDLAINEIDLLLPAYHRDARGRRFGVDPGPRAARGTIMFPSGRGRTPGRLVREHDRVTYTLHKRSGPARGNPPCLELIYDVQLETPDVAQAQAQRGVPRVPQAGAGMGLAPNLHGIALTNGLTGDVAGPTPTIVENPCEGSYPTYGEFVASGMGEIYGMGQPEVLEVEHPEGGVEEEIWSDPAPVPQRRMSGFFLASVVGVGALWFMSAKKGLK